MKLTSMPKQYECFLISAFGSKPLIKEPGQSYDFDVLQDEIKSAVQAYENTHLDSRINIKRADEYFGGVITQEFYQQLYKADLVVAEISASSPNVYYELGVRLALKRRATIVLAVEGTSLPFDIRDLRVVFYQPGNLRDKQDDLHRLIEARLQGEADSPVYVALPDLELVRREEMEILHRQMRTLQGITSRETYGFKITSPLEDAEVGEWPPVSGTFVTIPPKGSVRLFVKSPHGYGYWPQSGRESIVQLDIEERTWNSRAHFGGTPPEEGIITVAVVGKAGNVLWDYYEKVGQETRKWPSISELTDDIVECDHVKVVKTRRWFLWK